MSPRPFTLTSLLSPSADRFYAALAAHLGERFGRPVRYIDGPWALREQALDRGEIDAGFLCGGLYVRKVARDRGFAPLVAPVYAAARYHARPVYFADVVVHGTNPARSLGDLRGSRFAFNDPLSYSGLDLLRSELARRGARAGFFASVLATGSHLASLAQLDDRAADVATIDSTVIEDAPSSAAALRVVCTLGPRPAPPLVACPRMAPTERAVLTEILSSLHRDPAGLAVLATGRLLRFAPVADGDYDPIRDDLARADAVQLVSS